MSNHRGFSVHTSGGSAGHWYSEPVEPAPVPNYGCWLIASLPGANLDEYEIVRASDREKPTSIVMRKG